MQPCWSTVSEWVSAFPLSNTKLFLYNKATARLISHLETGRQLPSQPCRWAFTTNWQFDADRWETEMNWNFSPMRVKRQATMVGWLCALNHPSIVRDTVSQSLFLFVSVNGTVTLFTEWYKMQTKNVAKTATDQISVSGSKEFHHLCLTKLLLGKKVPRFYRLDSARMDFGSLVNHLVDQL